MEQLIKQIKDLQNSAIKEVIDKRILEFKKLGNRNSNEIFKELCFCLMTANFSAKGGIKIQNALGNELIDLPENQLAIRLKSLGHRFPNARAKYIAGCREFKEKIKEKLKSFSEDEERREWLVENIKGIGMKEASHFLRNIGYSNIAIIDFHIVDLLVANGLIEQPKSKSFTRKRYIEIEQVLKKLSDKVGIKLGELDLYLWYKETGEVLK
jgi:N-glycosylase/DNA lyase